MKLLRKSNIEKSSHTPITERLSSTENKIRKEVAIMKKCRHANVVRLLEVIDDKLAQKIYLSAYPGHQLLLDLSLSYSSPCINILCFLSHGKPRGWRDKVAYNWRPTNLNSQPDSKDVP